MSPSMATSYGQVIEYIQDRLYLASYTHPPNAHTPFPYPVKQARSPSKRSSRAQNQPQPVSSGPKAHPPAYFSIDKKLLYNAFHADFGPLHIGHLYRFAVQLHEVLADPANEDRAVVFWSDANARSRANAACILACYMVLIQSWPPHLALAPIAQMDPPCMPFRDAGYSQADYTLNIQDVVYGVWKAKEEGLCALKDFSLEEYEKFERVDMGDFNWLTPSFLAFASPQHTPIDVIPSSSSRYAALPKTSSEVMRTKELPMPFRNVLSHFKTRNIGLVVRLNSELYCPSYFTALGIQHLDMIFDDGTCPPLTLVKQFINLAHDMITIQNKGIAVHCKAGLGRTGCLIGAYLIYRHGFTANEIIAFMRFMRPGMVVGPQQHWLHLNQGTFREWWFEDCMKERMAAAAPSTPSRVSAHKQRLASNGQTFTPPNGNQKRSALGEIHTNEQENSMYMDTGVNEENLPAPTPGQPRKTSKAYGKGSPMRNMENHPMPDTEIVTMHRHLQDASESEEEIQLRLAARRAASRSPGTSPASKRRAVSHTTTTTVNEKWEYGADCESDIENRTDRAKTPGATKGGNGNNGSMSIGKTRSSPSRRSNDNSRSVSGVRKTSGRVGSMGSALAGSSNARMK
ncbi:tyrosine-protein phosphatase CDC14 [Aulographum hederae CBS 113979]|uniref:protein-tyrosine-phosphatase n=1 Tax=Aulographum hederae CBS 113979 TaxID=1176131 RepID=A0A6G1GT54_9PEZI|nr:tyrosine-protein phosphatase CDC14 [Aulographum hederae CBS 113979]